MAKGPRVVGIPAGVDIEMTYVFVGEPNKQQFDICDAEGMPRYIVTAKVINPEANEYGGTMQELLDAIAERGWRPGGTFTAGPNKSVWILWREKLKGAGE